MPYARLFYHLVWTTRQREPLLTAPVEPIILDAVRWKAIQIGGGVYALAAVADHVHMVADVPPRAAVDSFIRQVKSAATTKFNRRSPEEPLHWDEGFGAMTFDGKRLPYVIDYVEKQKELHGAGTIIPVLERTDDQPTGPAAVREIPALYHLDGEAGAWWREMLALEA